MTKLRDAKHFDYLVTIIGEDFGSEEGLGCIYILENTETHERISVKQMARQIGNDYVIPSVYYIWRAADLMEREVFDFFGIKFLGHPDMRRLFLRNDFVGYPLRKDYDMSPEHNQFPMTDEPETDWTSEWNLNDLGELVETKHRLFGPDDYVVNFGPNHPSTHGVLRLQTVVNDETIEHVYPHLGYIHRGMEKMMEAMTYPQTLALTDRLNYLCAMHHRHALVGVIEEAMGVELSDRIHYIRTIMDELQRIDNHLLFLGTCAQDLSALTAFLYCMRDREHVLNVMEETTGGRLIQNYYRIGGLQADIDPHFVENVKALCKYLRPMIQEYLDVFGDNVITHQRLEGVGYMNLADSINYALTGPAGRAAGWHNDVRKNHPYDLYDKVEWKEITGTGCDSMTRYMIHINEMYQSLNIIEQLIDNIPEGEFYIKQKPIIKVPEGQWWFSVEGGAGEFGVYLDSRGDKSPYRVKMRPMGLTLTGASTRCSAVRRLPTLLLPEPPSTSSFLIWTDKFHEVKVE